MSPSTWTCPPVETLADVEVAPAERLKGAGSGCRIRCGRPTKRILAGLPLAEATIDFELPDTRQMPALVYLSSDEQSVSA
jgi:hypothetical protein